MSNNYQCPKCNNTRYETDKISTEGGLLSRFFNVSTKSFTAVSCKNCGYTELYKGNVSLAGNIIDFMGN